ncbi:response regulator transcription factor [Flavobacterium laiguense]|uniref:HTH luxR-type domain-containing protein n=1 Tax=Flavobacterium laiguense TaxID=2169409 RepID=A0A2U1JKL4_9FLAO|nr:helix-turn-helix transcriptional regulator [Flavobacterium laiguense]PWA05519.1 hypothetical protein DB891_16825 [Flavobacterium laiguense]
MNNNYLNYKTLINHQEAEIISSVDWSVLSKFRDEINQLASVPFGILPTFYILNYQTNEYEFISKEFQFFSKHKVEEIMEGGIEKFLSIYQKDDFELYSEQIFSKNLEVILDTKPEERGQLIFTNTYRIFNHDKTISHILQKNRIIADPITGIPLHAYGSVSDLSNLKLFNRELYHRIEKTDALDSNKKMILLSNSYKVYDEDKKLTPQENRILELLIKGLTTKEIAQKLFVSFHTIDAHRSNILTKTNSKNVVQLISNFMK